MIKFPLERFVESEAESYGFVKSLLPIETTRKSIAAFQALSCLSYATSKQIQL